MLRSVMLLGVKLTNEAEEYILEYILTQIKIPQKKLFITTPNPEIIVYANKHLDYKDKLNSADIALPDGVGAFIASGVLGQRLAERIPGVDFMEFICEEVVGKPVSIGLLGGGPGIAQLTAECLVKKYPGLNIVYVSQEWGQDGFDWESRNRGTKQNNTRNNDQKSGVVQRSVRRGSAMIDILFVAFGFPKQEEWIYENLEKLPVRAAMGVGGAFDYISGMVPRAPYLIRAMGCEWLFRVIRQPWRIRRQLALGEFVFLVLKEALFRRRQTK